MKVGLFGGSFNPVHTGHIYLAEAVLEKTDIDEVWFIISPQNPFKMNHELVDENLRKDMVDLMIGHDHRMKACDIEFNLPRPSYTYTTIETLKEKYPSTEFEFIIGSDALNNIKSWRNYEDIIQMPIIGVIRDGEVIKKDIKDIIKNLNIIHSESDTSSTIIRNYIQSGRIDELENIQLLNKKTIEFIKDNKLYND